MAIRRGIRWDDRLAGKRVLLVEDDVGFFVILNAILQRAGAIPSHEADGRQALERLRTPVDILVLDLVLPHLSGFDILEHLRATNRPLLAHTIVFTAYGREVDEHLGNLRIIHKPLDLQLFLDTLSDALHDRAPVLPPLHDWQTRLPHIQRAVANTTAAWEEQGETPAGF